MKHPNFPFAEIAAACEKKIAEGWTIYQKFTCAKCGERLTMPDKNKLYVTGHCEHCDHVTDIQKDGCNYRAVWSSTGKLPDGI